MENQPKEPEKDMGIAIIQPRDLTKSVRKVKAELPKYWDNEEVKRLIDGIKNYKHKMLVMFLWMTGLRITEAISLTKGDIDFQNYTMTVRWLKNRKYSHRVVPIHPKLKDILSLYVATMNSPDRVFPMSRQRAWQIVRKNMNGHPHQLRHSFAVHWLRNDGNIIILHRIMGHANVQTTMEYLKIVPTDQGKELLKIPF
jgi:integrase/recombinase XerD